MTAAKKPTAKVAARKSAATNAGASETFTAEERAAIKERAMEVKAARGRSGGKGGKAAAEVDGESTVLAKIAELPEPDRTMAERVHAVITASAPELEPRLWYGMPAYAKDGKVVCFFQPASKFKARYSTLGFNDVAMLDDGVMWPTAYAVTRLSPEAEKTIAAVVKAAVG